MKRSKFWWVLALMAALALCLPFFALAEGNIIQNGGFEEGADGMPSGWSANMWQWEEGISYLTVEGEAYSGAQCVLVENADVNDARFEQRVQVEPDTLYRITCMAKAEGCDPSESGVSISVADTFESSSYLYDTQGQWQQLTLYGRTGSDQHELTLMARVGGYGSLNAGKGWFDDFEMVRVEEAPVGAYVADFATNPPSGEVDSGEEEVAVGGYTPLIVMVAMAFLAVSAAFLVRAGQSPLRLEKKEKYVKRSLLLLLTVAFIGRLALALTIRGYGVDMSCFEGWASRMVETGPVGFYAEDSFCDYPPGYLYVLWLIGGLIQLMGIPYDGPFTWLMIKLVPMLMDMGCAYLIYKMCRRSLGENGAALLSLFYALNPAVLINSAAWGQIDAVLTILLALSMVEAVKGRWLRSLPLYALAVLVKPQALMFGPIGLFAVIMELVRSRDRAQLAKRLGLAALAALGVLVLVPLPFLVGQEPWYLFELYKGTLSSYPYVTINTLNAYVLFDLNWASLSEYPLLSYLGVLMYVLAFGYGFFLYVRSKDRRKLFVVCAVVLYLIFSFGIKMHERYIYPALVLLALAYGVDRDKRLLASLIALSFTQFINVALVLQAEHLQSGQWVLNNLVALINVLNALFLCWVGFDLCIRRRVVPLRREERGEASFTPIAMRTASGESLLRPEDHRLNMKKLDWALMLGLTLVYGVMAFTNLGSTKAPQTSWISTAPGEQLTFDLGEVHSFHMTYYGGICNSSFEVEFSEDGENWSEPHLAVYDQGEIFRWLWYAPSTRNEDGDGFTQLEKGYPMQTARYVRLTAERVGLTLHEVAFLDGAGQVLPITSVAGSGGEPERVRDPRSLIDEQDTVPEHPSYYNGTYFDEIYHARTGYEHYMGMRPYETTHPPLGKDLIMLGISLFGMTPFGWRFMGALAGVLMVPLMYLLAKQLFKKTNLAFIASFLLTFDFMHFTQTRIATIDSYGVFFIMLMYLFMFRYLQMNFFHQELWRTLVPLGLCGISMGLGIASKWICIYAAIGLAVLFFYTLYRRYREYAYARRNRNALEGAERAMADRAIAGFWRNTLMTLGFCLVFFVVIPILIYYYSYYWYMLPSGGLSWDSVWQAQVGMFNYHNGLADDTHFFRSPWYQWPLMIKPMWYYSGNEFMPSGTISTISAFGNPVVWWGGLAALVFMLVHWVRGKFRGDRTPLYLTVSFASQYVPWIFIARSTFIYHYFASVPFLILCTALAFDAIEKRSRRAYKITLWCTLGLAAVLFLCFYPIISGYPMARNLAMLLRWFDWYLF